MLMESDSTITAERASNILGVSSRTIETYIAKLKESKVLKLISFKIINIRNVNAVYKIKILKNCLKISE